MAIGEHTAARTGVHALPAYGGKSGSPLHAVARKGFTALRTAWLVFDELQNSSWKARSDSDSVKRDSIPALSFAILRLDLAAEGLYNLSEPGAQMLPGQSAYEIIDSVDCSHCGASRGSAYPGLQDHDRFRAEPTHCPGNEGGLEASF